MLPWNVTPRTSLTVAGCFGLTPAVAALAVSRLIEDLASVAGDQRLATPDDAGRRVLNDLDALVERVLSVVDVEALGSAVSLGVCEVADYAANPASDRRDFLVGVDAAPAHIGANYDIIRPEPSRAVQVGLETARYCLIAGPSGAGKSAQIWRAARDIAPGARVLRMLRLATQADSAVGGRRSSFPNWRVSRTGKLTESGNLQSSRWSARSRPRMSGSE